MKKSITVACPHCQKEMIWDSHNLFRPFCSARCKLIDFGAWVDERHAIAGAPEEVTNDDLLDDDSTQ